MKVSMQWLRDWVEVQVAPQDLAAQLSMAGLEVESWQVAAPPFSKVVVGRVLRVEPHPNADRLRVTSVDVGSGEALNIVCGAPNVAVDMCVPTALIGAELPGGLTIKKAKLRGVESQGMLCSAKELGLAETAEGLLALPTNSQPGQDLRVLLHLDDAILEVELTPNRGDCLSMEGVAREVAVLNRQPFQALAVPAVPAQATDTFPIRLESPAACPRYLGRVVRGVNAQAPTPLWMQERLRRAGLRSLGPLVDVTNYVMLELGQPMHAFDLQRLSGGIVVRHARAGEQLALLNGTMVELDTDTLLIADHAQPLALAGIMGGEISSCTEATRDVLLESAFFAPASIAGRARRYGLHTDAAYRFERGVDAQLQRRAMERATQLLLELAGGQASAVLEAVAPEQLPQVMPIELRRSRLAQLLGMQIADAEVVDILQRLGMEVETAPPHWRVTPPSARFDLALEVDLIEEVVRIHGYQRVPSKRPLTRLAMPPQSETKVSVERCSAVLVQRGFQEAITYSFVDAALQQRLDPQRPALALANPISADLAVMRTSLWPGLLKALLHNQKRQQNRVRLFEHGLTFVQGAEQLQQQPYLGGVVSGTAFPEQWGVAGRMVDFFDLKADVEALLALTGESANFNFVAATHPALHPGQSAQVQRHGQALGWMGALHPQLARELDVEGDIFLFELSLTALAKARLPQATELSRFPASRRDLALLVDESVSAQALQDSIRAHAGELLREVWLFDVYRGQGVAAGQKSLAFGLNLQDFSRSLTDQAVEEVMSSIVAGLASQFGATLRI